MPMISWRAKAKTPSTALAGNDPANSYPRGLPPYAGTRHNVVIVLRAPAARNARLKLWTPSPRSIGPAGMKMQGMSMLVAPSIRPGVVFVPTDLPAHVVAGDGREGEMQRWSSYPMSLPSPASDAVRTGQRIILNGEAAIEAAYPEMRDTLNRGERSLICLPLNVATRTIGAIGLSFPGVRSWDAAELDFFEILADTCAQALDRISAQEVAARQSAKLVFLADASTELASSLDYEVTLAKVARLAVPTFADWCAIDVAEDREHLAPGPARTDVHHRADEESAVRSAGDGERVPVRRAEVGEQSRAVPRDA